MLIPSILVGLTYWLAMGRAQYYFSFAFRNPVVLGVVIGWIFGDVSAGLLYGATIQLLYMGGIEAGGNIPSDRALAACIAIPAALQNGLDPNTAVALAVPFGVLGVLINNVRRTINSFYNTQADKFVSEHEWLMNGLSNAGGMLPALGFALTLVVMGKKQYLPFFVIGFFAYSVLGFSMLTGAVFAVCIAMISSLYKQSSDEEEYA